MDVRNTSVVFERNRRGRLAMRAWVVAALALVASASAHAQLLEIDDPTLPASPDGFNITQDFLTGLEWLDVTVSAGRSFDDIIGADGTNEFASGGDFEGFRHATFLELTGWINGPQQDSLFVQFGFTSGFSSIGGYGPVRDLISYVGCLANCGAYGYVSGAYAVNETSPLTPRWAIADNFPNGGLSWGSLGADYPHPPTSRPENGSQTGYGHFLVRPLPEPAMATGLATGLLGMTCFERRRTPRS